MIIITKKKTTGRGKLKWEYYDRFKEIFADDKSVNMPHLMASTISTSTMNQIVATASATSKSPAIKGLESNEENSSNSESTMGLSSRLVSKQSPATETPKTKRLDTFRKRQLELEERKLDELKKLREAVEENNRINLLKVNMLNKYLCKEIKDGKGVVGKDET